ncbi:hypothetical protein F4777DRAFT_145357 [Nemania sp. FL0916]|nr:hypothetical protein F4777DRAFT_145357 [Nemania sp. FL0916]
MGVSHVRPRSPRQAARLRQIVVISVLCLAIYCFLLTPSSGSSSTASKNSETWESPPLMRPGKGAANGRSSLPPELLNNRFLTEDQCRATFPRLLEQVDDEVAKGPFTLTRTPGNLGPTIARIRDGQLYILSAARKSDLSKDMLAHRAATLHQIANALLTWPRSPSSHSSIPETIIAFNHHDDPKPNTFSYSRPADPMLQSNAATGAKKRFWVIPHFSLYSWPLPFIGSLPRAAEAISRIEEELGGDDDLIRGEGKEKESGFAKKIPRAVWRGTTWFNNPRAGRLRQNLVRAFGTKPDSSPSSSTSSSSPINPAHPWADIQALDWAGTPATSIETGPGAGERNATNALRIEDFCRYKYVVHTEGVTYSGRFQFHTLCASVVVAPPVAWVQHLTHLLRPVFSSTLDPDAPDSDSPPFPSSHSSSHSLFSSHKKHQGEKEQEQTGPGLPRTPIHLGPRDPPPSLLPYPAPWVQSAWPVSYSASSSANIVFVAPDWSDLEATILWLESHPRIAEGIARRQRALFHGGGYFSPAAEMCYWRGLIRGWSEVVQVEDGAFEDLEEVTWEEFSLKEIHK